MIHLDKLLTIFRGNQTQAAKFLRLNRGTFRTQHVEGGLDIIIHNGKVYREVGEVERKHPTDGQLFDLALGFKKNDPAQQSAPEMYDMIKNLSEMIPMLDEQTNPQIEMDAVKHDIDKLLAKARGQRHDN